MTYNHIKEFTKDLSYSEDIIHEGMENKGTLRFTYNYYRDVRRLIKEWRIYMKERFEKSKNSKRPFGKFITKYDLSFKETCCLVQLINNDIEKTDYESFNWIEEDSEDYFSKNNIMFEISQLKREKLVFKIVNPLRPRKINYVVSFKAQMELFGQKYTEAYQQQDMSLEQQSKINSPDQLESLYYLVKPKLNFDDLIVKDELKEALNTAMVREQSKKLIFNQWGLGKMMEYGRGTTLNFRGPPGTGKTLAANALANALEKELMIVRYDQLQNMYVGQTEKHVQQVFKIAKLKNAVLFFDEADAVAMSRQYLEKSWEMSQINTLLKELERFDGICVFATNYAEKYDPAFERRLTMHLDFELPDKKMGEIILDRI
jgi:ATP-dependent Zn protease